MKSESVSTPVGLAWCLIAFSVTGLLGCAGVSETGELRVGSDLSNPPFAFEDGTGQPAGLEVAMIRALALDLGLELRWERMEFAELLDAVVEERIDVACATLGVSPARAQRVDFSSPYYETSIAVVTRVGPVEPNSITDLQTGRIAASKGTTSEVAVRARMPEADWVFEPEDETPVVELLLSGKIDAAVMDDPNARALVATRPGLRVLPEPLAEERYALAISKRNRALRDRIDEALERLRRAGELPTSESVAAARDPRR